MHDVRSIARALGGEVSGGRIRCPGPGHSKHDRSMWVALDWQAPDGFIVGSFAGDPFDLCRDHVRRMLGMEPWQRQRKGHGVEISTPDVVFTTSPFPVPSVRANDAGDDPRREKIESQICLSKAAQRHARLEGRRLSELALAIFRDARPIRGTLGERYLKQRLGRTIEWPNCLRFDPQCVRKVQGADGNDRIERHPAILALMRDIRSNEPRGIQRIFLQPDGLDRLRDPKGKATLGPAIGAVVKLSPDETVSTGLGLCEGIETALALIAIGWAPIWATAGTSGMSAFPVVDGIETLSIFADNDPPRPAPHKGEGGQRAAAAVAKRWADAGKGAKVVLPKITGTDWLDALREAA